jgi:adenylate cyclase
MDMTVTGPAANEVSRIESLCKPLKIAIIASQEFRQAFDGDLTSLGHHKLDGITSEMEVFTQPGLVA